jgi:hypothetical protein
MKTWDALRLKISSDYKESRGVDYFSGLVDRPSDKGSTSVCWHGRVAADCRAGNSDEQRIPASDTFSMSH